MQNNATLINKRAVTYSLLAHINNSGTLTKGPLDIFIPIVKKGLHIINNRGQFKGEHINEIISVVKEVYGIEIPTPVMRNILTLLANEINKDEEIIFKLHSDDSFWIEKYIFEDYDQELENSKKDIEHLQTLFNEFCKINNVTTQNNCIVKFIEKNKVTISHYIANKNIVNGHDYTIEAKFVEFFRSSSSQVYEQIKNIYLGSILTSYLEYKPSKLNIKVDLLFDTNFIISLLDLNTKESTHTCRKLLEVGESLGFMFHVLSDTIDEAQRLLYYKADNFDKSVVQKFVNKEDIYNACNRLHYSKTDLERISDNLEETLLNYKINTIPHTEKLRNKARSSTEYNALKQYRNTPKSALHDAMCILYVKEKREGKKISNFEKVNCWWVNNATSHDFDTEGITSIINENSLYLPEIIKVDDLLNILWLSSPNLSILAKDDILDMGLTSLVAYTLNQGLPKARIIKELDENIQKYKNEKITDRDVYLLSTRIANGQVKNIEKLNELVKTDIEKFNQGVKEEAEKQEKIEKERAKMLEEIVEKFKNEIKEIQEHKKNIDKKGEAKIKQSEKLKLQEIDKKNNEIQRLKDENRRHINKQKKIERDKFIDKELKAWRRRTWHWIIRVSILLILGIIWIAYSFDNMNDVNTQITSWLGNKIISFSTSFVFLIIDVFLIKDLYNKYSNHSNINAYISKINIPEEFKELNNEN